MPSLSVTLRVAHLCFVERCTWCSMTPKVFDAHAVCSPPHPQQTHLQGPVNHDEPIGITCMPWTRLGRA